MMRASGHNTMAWIKDTSLFLGEVEECYFQFLLLQHEGAYTGPCVSRTIYKDMSPESWLTLVCVYVCYISKLSKISIY